MPLILLKAEDYSTLEGVPEIRDLVCKILLPVAWIIGVVAKFGYSLTITLGFELLSNREDKC